MLIEFPADCLKIAIAAHMAAIAELATASNAFLERH
jgi:hypothetical protein